MATIPKFPYAPKDIRSGAEQTAQRATVRKQIEPWVKKLTNPATRMADELEAMTVLQDRRGGAGVTAFEVDEDEFPVAPHRLLVRDSDAADVTLFLAAKYAPQEVPIPGLTSLRVLQDIGAGARPLRSSGAVARTVTARRAVPSYVALLGAVRKAVGGPEPVPPPTRKFAEAEGSAISDRGPVVVIIDNGVSAESRADGWLNGLARIDNLDLLNVVPLDNYLDLAAGHGTFTAGIVQQVAPAADLDVRRVLDTEGVGDEIEIGREIISAAERGAEIINLSLGLLTADDQRPLALETAIQDAITVARDKHKKHLLLVCAAGNYADERPCWPAAFATEPGFTGHVISVAALRRDYDDPTQVVGAEWSTHGERVTISTFGQGVVSTYVVGTEAPTTDPDPDTFGPSSWATWSGTSFAAPQVTGAIVRLMQERQIPTARAALDQLKTEGAAVIAGYGTSIEILPV